jgi:hypothetical protein
MLHPRKDLKMVRLVRFTQDVEGLVPGRSLEREIRFGAAVIQMSARDDNQYRGNLDS